jgi:hypothetical protein
MKISKSFRLSVQALEALSYLSGETGTNETAILEIALAHYRRAYNSSKLIPSQDNLGQVNSVQVVSVGQVTPKKKRKRH